MITLVAVNLLYAIFFIALEFICANRWIKIWVQEDLFRAYHSTFSIAQFCPIIVVVFSYYFFCISPNFYTSSNMISNGTTRGYNGYRVPFILTYGSRQTHTQRFMTFRMFGSIISEPLQWISAHGVNTLFIFSGALQNN